MAPAKAHSVDAPSGFCAASSMACEAAAPDHLRPGARFLETMMSKLTMTSRPLRGAGASQPWLAPLAARVLGAASRLLGRLEARLDRALLRQPTNPLPAVLEFYADAGAPEGALYLDGELVGLLDGVTRL